MDNAGALKSDVVPSQLRQARRLITEGQIANAIAVLGDLERRLAQHSELLGPVIEAYAQLNRHSDAYRCARQYAKSGDKAARFALVSASNAVGRTDEAESILGQLLSEYPDEPEMYYTRSTLRRHTAENNHVAQLRDALDRLGGDPNCEIPLCFALGKELEELGNHDEAFAHFARGARSRLSRLSYDVQSDEAAMELIRRVFDQTWWGDATGDAEDNTQRSGPVFIFGLPRSGTTLVERILASHPEVGSLGEINDFAYAVMRAGQPASNKAELIENVAKTDMESLGRAYREATLGYGEQRDYLIDKTPANFLYLGLLAKAMPEARLIHVQRHPMASGYALFKSLFRMGSPYSYDLEMIGRYMLAYKHLMAHWRSLFGNRILDVHYETLVDEQESVSRAIVAHCGLDWSDQCLRFHENAAPTATASASQVREPIYRSAYALWHHYEEQLEPLAKVLEKGGIDVSPV